MNTTSPNLKLIIMKVNGLNIMGIQKIRSVKLEGCNYENNQTPGNKSPKRSYNGR